MAKHQKQNTIKIIPQCSQKVNQPSKLLLYISGKTLMQQDNTVKKQLAVSKKLKEKLTFLVNSLKVEKVGWVNDHTFTLTDTQLVKAKLTQVFDMSFNTFIKFIQMMGCKVKQLRTKEASTPKVYRIVMVTQEDESQTKTINEILKSDDYQNGANFDEVSIEVNMQRPELELFNLQNESQMKDAFLKSFQNNIESTNQFVDHMIYRILVERSSKQMSICQVLELLTQLRDRMFENQKDIQQCIGNFQHKIQNYRQDQSHQSIHNATMSNKSLKQKEEEVSIGEEIKNNMESQ